jgi:anti-sigma-K factor RskA
MNGHPTRPEDFDLYALGVLEGEEKAAFEAHVPTCAACAEKLAEARGRIALLAFAAPRVEPSASVKERLMRQIHAAPAGARVPQRGRATLEPERTGGFFGRWWAAAVLVPVAAVLILVSARLWQENAHLVDELGEERATLQKQQAQLDEARHIVALMEAKDTKTVALAPQPGMAKGDVRVMYNAKMGMAMCDGWVDPAPANKSYQLWLVPMDGKPISAGLVEYSIGPMKPWMVKLPPGVAAKAFAITLEPEGGMPQPTGPMVLVGPVS